MKTRFFAILCALVLLVSAVPAASALEGESLRAADTLAALNIVRGDYGLDAPATRAHAAVLLVRLAGAGSKAASATSRSPYYTAPAYARSSIAYAAGQGWITSLSAQSYRPDAPVTADAWCSMLLRILRQGRGFHPLRCRGFCPAYRPAHPAPLRHADKGAAFPVHAGRPHLLL